MPKVNSWVKIDGCNSSGCGRHSCHRYPRGDSESSSVLGFISELDDLREALSRSELQFYGLPLSEERLAVADNDGEDGEIDHVDQALFELLGGDRDALESCGLVGEYRQCQEDKAGDQRRGAGGHNASSTNFTRADAKNASRVGSVSGIELARTEAL